MKFFGDLPKEVKGLGIVGFFVSIGFGVQAPALPVFARELGAGTAALGAMIAAFALTRMVSAWPIGRLLNAMGERKTLMIGMVLVAATSILAGFSQTAWQLIVFRGLGGIGSAGFSIATTTLLLRKMQPHARGRALGFFMGCMNVGLVAGPALGGLLLVFPPRWIFFLYGALAAITALVSMRILEHEPKSHHGVGRGHLDAVGLVEALRTSTYRAAVTMNFSLGWLVYGARSSFLPLLLLNVMHEDARWIGISLSMGSVLQVVVLPAAGRLTDLWGRKWPLVGGATVLVISVAQLLVMQNLTGYLICIALMGLGAAFCTTASSASLGDITRGGHGGTVVAMHQMAADLGMVVGPLIAGVLAESSYDYALAITIAIGVWAVVMGLLMPRNTLPIDASADSNRD